MKRSFDGLVVGMCAGRRAGAGKGRAEAGSGADDEYRHRTDCATPPIYVQQPVYTQPPPPAAQLAPAAQPAPAPFVYDQQPVQPPAQLISQTDAQSIVDQFRTNYSRLGNPRFLIFVNRDLVDAQSGLKLSARSETVTSKSITGSNSTNPSVATETVAQKITIVTMARPRSRRWPIARLFATWNG